MSSREELEAKIGARTAMLLILGDADSGGLGCRPRGRAAIPRGPLCFMKDGPYKVEWPAGK